MSTKVMAFLRSLKEAGDPENGDSGHRMAEVIIIDNNINNAVVAEYNGNLYHGIFNAFNCRFYIDDVDGYIRKAGGNE